MNLRTTNRITKKIFDELNQEYEKRMDLQKELNLLLQKVGTLDLLKEYAKQLKLDYKTIQKL